MGLTGLCIYATVGQLGGLVRFLRAGAGPASDSRACLWDLFLLLGYLVQPRCEDMCLVLVACYAIFA